MKMIHDDDRREINISDDNETILVWDKIAKVMLRIHNIGSKCLLDSPVAEFVTAQITIQEPLGIPAVELRRSPLCPLE